MAAAFRATLAEHSVPDAVQDALIQDGYASATLFRFAFISEEALQDYASDLLVVRAVVPNVTAANLGRHPALASLRSLRHSLDEAAAPPVQAAPALGLVPPAIAGFLGLGLANATEHLHRLGPELMLALEREFEDANRRELFDPDELPHKSLLQLTYGQARSQHFEYIPLKKCVSKGAAAAMVQTGRSAERAFLSLMAEANGLHDVSLDDHDGNPRLLNTAMKTRGVAYAMSKAGDYATWKLTRKRFMHHFTKRVPDPAHFRRCNASEVEEAERIIFTEVFRLVRDGWTLDDALHEVTVTRDAWANLLQPRLKPMRHSAPPPPPGRGRERSRGRVRLLPAHLAEPDLEPNGRKGKGKGKGKAIGLCNRFNRRGGCNQPASECRFKHECSRCGATDHGAASTSCPGS